MYDKVKFVLRQLPAGYNWREVLERIHKDSYKCNDSGGWGYWRGYRINVKEHSVRFEASLPKCLHENNVCTLSLKEVESLIEEMSCDWGIPMEDAEVESLEFGYNFEMEKPPLMYIDKLRAPQDFISNQWNNRTSCTVYMDKGKMRLKFYDKTDDARQKKQYPDFPLPEHLLRYEVTFENNLLERMFGRTLTAKDLWNKRVFWTLVAEWFGLYEEVEKLPCSYWNMDFNKLNNKKHFLYWCVCTLNERQNLPYYIKRSFIGRSNPRPNDRKLHQSIQRCIREALKWGKDTFPADDLMLELNTKIEAYLIWLLEQSEDGMSVEEERRLFSTSV